MMIPVHFMAELSVSILCLTAAVTLALVGRALIRYLWRKSDESKRDT